jgi:precorrin-6A/cobalt-precorrin-6A reductase
VTITAHAAAAARETEVPLVVLRRAGWRERPGDDWLRVPDITAAAAATAAAPPGCVFVTTGRRDLVAFAGDDAHDHLVRSVDPPDPPLPPRTTLLLDRGPFTVEAESALMDTHGVVVLATKDSGGPMTRAKLDAARTRQVPVVMVDRPPAPDGVLVVDTVADAIVMLAGVMTAGRFDERAQPG